MSSQRPNIYLDLDRTLFQTEKASEIWKILKSKYPKLPSLEALYGESRQFYVTNDSGYYFYDWVRHLESYEIDLEEASQVILHSEIADGRMEYPGTEYLLKTLKRKKLQVQILTFGEDYYQRVIKLGLCPNLKNLPIVTTLEAKDLFFKNNPLPAVLLDDKPIGDDLPSHVEFYQAVGYNQIAPPLKSDWRVVRSLKEFADIIASKFDD